MGLVNKLSLKRTSILIPNNIDNHTGHNFHILYSILARMSGKAILHKSAQSTKSTLTLHLYYTKKLNLNSQNENSFFSLHKFSSFPRTQQRQRRQGISRTIIISILLHFSSLFSTFLLLIFLPRLPTKIHP